MTRSAIFLGDLADALRWLRPGSNSTVSSVTAALGLGGLEPIDALVEPASSRREPEPVAELSRFSSAPIPAPTSPPAPVGRPTSAVRLVERPQVSRIRPARTIARTHEYARFEAPAVDPLFDPRRARQLLIAAVNNTVEEGELDFERVLEAIANAELLESVPRLPVATLRHGVSVLVDDGPAMTIYRDDLRRVLSGLRGIFSSSLELHWFVDSPSSLRNALGRPCPLRFGQRGRPVFALTDLGRARARVRVDEWVEFSRCCRAHGRPLLVLTPWWSSECPAAVRRRVPILSWDHRTTVHNVRRVRRA